METLVDFWQTFYLVVLREHDAGLLLYAPVVYKKTIKADIGREAMRMQYYVLERN